MAGRIARLLLTRCARGYRLQGALVVLSTLLAGCSSVFFYPDNVTYITPDRLNLAYQDIYLDTADGETLHGWWLPAEGPESDARGTIYFLHGNAQNISSHILNVAWLPLKATTSLPSTIAATANPPAPPTSRARCTMLKPACAGWPGNLPAATPPDHSRPEPWRGARHPAGPGVDPAQ